MIVMIFILCMGRVLSFVFFSAMNVSDVLSG